MAFNSSVLGLSAIAGLGVLWTAATASADPANAPGGAPPPAMPTAPTAPPGPGPAIEMPPGTSAPSEADPEIEESDLVRGMQDYRFRSARTTSIGGYGELHYNLHLPPGGESEAELDLHRLVLFVAHKFSDEIRLYTEIEIEHAFSSFEDAAPGEVGIEQAYVDWQPWGEALGLRAGVVLVPMGIVNQWHEPPVFHGVERPRVDNVIIPTTWREGGIGIFGEPVEGFRYELYLVGGLNAARFDAARNIREGRQGVAEALANGPAVTGRVEWEPTLGVVVGGSGYFGLAGPNAGELNRLVGRDLVTGAPILERLDLDVPVLGLSLDARVRWRGLEARAAFATFSVGNTAGLRQAVDAEGELLGIDVGSRSLGFYGELAYDVLRLFMTTEHQLLPFFRFEYYDTMVSLSGRTRTAADDANGGIDLVFGLSYRPIVQLVVKADFTYRNANGAGSVNDDRIVNFGVGWMF